MPENEKMNAPDALEPGIGEDRVPGSGSAPRVFDASVIASRLAMLAGVDIDKMKERIGARAQTLLIGALCDAIQEEALDDVSPMMAMGVCARMSAFNMARHVKPGHEELLFNVQVTQMRKDYESACTFFAAQRAEDAADDAEKGGRCGDR